MLEKLKSQLNISRIDADLEIEKEKAQKIYNKKPEMVKCEYCKQMLPKKEAGSIYNIENGKLYFHHEECFNENETCGTLEDLLEAGE